MNNSNTYNGDHPNAYVMALYGTLFCMVKSSATDKTMTSTEEEVGIVRREMRKSIEHMAINGHRNRSRKHRTFVEGKPVGMVIV
jgi:hypothetical protein